MKPFYIVVSVCLVALTGFACYYIYQASDRVQIQGVSMLVTPSPTTTPAPTTSPMPSPTPTLTPTPQKTSQPKVKATATPSPNSALESRLRQLNDEISSLESKKNSRKTECDAIYNQILKGQGDWSFNMSSHDACIGIVKDIESKLMALNSERTQILVKD